jgi:hypothetical protein
MTRMYGTCGQGAGPASHTRPAPHFHRGGTPHPRRRAMSHESGFHRADRFRFTCVHANNRQTSRSVSATTAAMRHAVSPTFRWGRI